MAQPIYLDWAKGFGDTMQDISNDITLDASGNVFFTGKFTDVATGSSTIFIHKLDNSGNTIWTKSLEPVGFGVGGEGQAIAIDESGDVHVIGEFEDTIDADPGPGVVNLTSKGFEDIFIAKLDTSGNLLWAHSFGSDQGAERGTSIGLDLLGNVLFTGSFDDTVDFDPGPGIFNLTTIPPTDAIFITKLDPLGNLVWAKSLVGEEGGFGRSIAVDPSGNSFTTGFFYDTIDFDPGPGIFNLTSGSSAKEAIFITKLDPSGNLAWAKSMAGSPTARGEDIALDLTGNIYLAGEFEDTIDFDPGAGVLNLVSVMSSSDIFITKLDSSGNVVLAKSLGGTGPDSGLSIDVDDFENIYASGYFVEKADFDPGLDTFYLEPSGNGDIFIMKMDASGVLLWAESFGDTSADYSSGIAFDGDRNILVTGIFTDQVDLDPGVFTSNLLGNGQRDVFVAKFNLCSHILDTLNGTIVDENGNGITKGEVLLFDISNSTGGFDTLNLRPIVNQSGNYSLAEVGHCEFLIFAIPDSTIYPGLIPTYIGNAVNWYTADTFFAQNFMPPDTIRCVAVSPPSGSGTNVVRGYVINNQINKRAEPLEDEDVILIESPPGIARGYIRTDQDGYFEFSNLDNGRYELIIEIAGIPMDGFTNVFNFTGSGDTSDVTAEVDSNVITVNKSTSISEINQNSNFRVLPNPSKGLFKLFLYAQGGQNVVIDVTDISGNQLYTLSFAASPGINIMPINLSMLSSGIYFLTVIQGTDRGYTKIVIE